MEVSVLEKLKHHFLTLEGQREALDGSDQRKQRIVIDCGVASCFAMVWVKWVSGKYRRGLTTHLLSMSVQCGVLKHVQEQGWVDMCTCGPSKLASNRVGKEWEVRIWHHGSDPRQSSYSPIRGVRGEGRIGRKHNNKFNMQKKYAKEDEYYIHTLKLYTSLCRLLSLTWLRQTGPLASSSSSSAATSLSLLTTLQRKNSRSSGHA